MNGLKKFQAVDVWSSRDIGVRIGAHLEALVEEVLMLSLDSMGN